MAALVAGVLLALFSPAAATPARSCRGLTDNILCMPLPRSWHRSVGFGHAGGPAAWMLAGNFRFARDAAKHEGTPAVLPHRVLITIGDFPVFKRWSHWPRVRRLHLPGGPVSKRSVYWHVRFGGRALWLSVHFGSRPDPSMRQLVDKRLASVYRRST